MNPAVIHLGLLALAATTLIGAAVSDARSYRIPNNAVLVLALLFPVYVFTSPTEMIWVHHLYVGLAVLSVGFVLFAFNIAGAGDIKLLAVMGLWAGPYSVAALLAITGLAGGLLSLSLAGVTHYRNQHKSPDQAVSLRTLPIPYGVAIAIGGLAALMESAHPLLFSA